MSEAEALASLDDVLSGNEPAAVEQDVITGEPEAQVEVEQEATENLEQEVEAKAEQPKHDSTPESDVDTEWTKAMALDERRKRQELERRLEEINSRKVEQVETPDVFENQEAFVEHLRGEFKAEAQKIRIETSQEIMRSLHEDYDAREEQFVAMARDNPILIQEMNQSGNPAKFAYDTAVKAERLKMLENVDELEARIRQEIEAKVRAEIAGETQQKAESLEQKRKSVPPSLTNASGKSGFDSDVSETLDDILG